MKIRAGGGDLGQGGGGGGGGGTLGQQGAPPCYSSLWETLDDIPERIFEKISRRQKTIKNFAGGKELSLLG